jgi:hypothetical protein
VGETGGKGGENYSVDKRKRGVRERGGGVEGRERVYKNSAKWLGEVVFLVFLPFAFLV